jgi:hypothetical protein
VLPPNSTRSTHDPYEDQEAKKRRSATIGFLIAVAAWLAFAKIFHSWPF